MGLRTTAGLLAIVTVAPLFAQPAQSKTPRTFRSDVRLAGYRFGNFFQAAGGAPEADVTALGLELRAAYRPWSHPTDLYAHTEFLSFTSHNVRNTYAGRLGIAHYGPVHQVNAYIDRAENRASFDVGDTTATGDVTALDVDYSYRVTPDWQLGAETRHERQRFSVGGTGRDNDYSAFGGSVRYRGFGWHFSPSIGYVTGERSVDNERDSYDDSYWFAQVTYQPHERLYTSLRYRDRTRDYQTIDRTDDRGSWTATVVLTQTEHLSWLVYYSREDVHSSQPGRDFASDVLIGGVTWAF